MLRDDVGLLYTEMTKTLLVPGRKIWRARRSAYRSFIERTVAMVGLGTEAARLEYNAGSTPWVRKYAYETKPIIALKFSIHCHNDAYCGFS